MHCAFVSDCASSARQRLSIKLMAACAHPLAKASSVLSAKSKTAPPSDGKRDDTPRKAERIKSGEGAIRPPTCWPSGIKPSMVNAVPTLTTKEGSLTGTQASRERNRSTPI